MVIIFKNETQNLQGIDTFSIFNIYSKIPKKRNYLLKQLYAFFITICKKNSKIHSYEKKKNWAKKHAILFFNNTIDLLYLVCAQKGENTPRVGQNCCHIVLFLKVPCLNFNHVIIMKDMFLHIMVGQNPNKSNSIETTLFNII